MTPTTDAFWMAWCGFGLGYGLGIFTAVMWAWMQAAGLADEASERERDWLRYGKVFRQG